MLPRVFGFEIVWLLSPYHPEALTKQLLIPLLQNIKSLFWYSYNRLCFCGSIRIVSYLKVQSLLSTKEFLTVIEICTALIFFFTLNMPIWLTKLNMIDSPREWSILLSHSHLRIALIIWVQNMVIMFIIVQILCSWFLLVLDPLLEKTFFTYFLWVLHDQLSTLISKCYMWKSWKKSYNVLKY